MGMPSNADRDPLKAVFLIPDAKGSPLVRHKVVIVTAHFSGTPLISQRGSHETTKA